MEFVVIGFGGMGCRHAQSVLNAKLAEKLYVLEASDEVFKNNLERINYTSQQVVRLNSINEIPKNVDFAIVATSSEPRFEITKQLIQHGIKTFLLEKVVFQSISQFGEIIRMASELNVKVFGNLPNRYFQNYEDIRNFIASKKDAYVKTTVCGGDFGMACNSIHYVDLFRYITGFDLVNAHSQLTVSENTNRRGAQYRELNGTLTLRDKNSRGEITLVSEKNFKGGVIVSVTVDKETIFLYENEQVEYSTFGNKSTSRPFEIIYSSVLTARIVKDIAAGVCRLPSLGHMKESHEVLFNVFNPAFGLKNDQKTICPIT